MRIIKYSGESKNIGRFGFVKKGQQISLTEGEWMCVRESKDYKLVGGDVTAEAIELAKGTLPFGTPLCDLRTIPWENERLSERLAARFSRKQLAEILESMRLVGAAIPVINLDQDKLFVVDAIVTASVIMGWPALGEEVRVKLPAVAIGPDGKAVIPGVSVEGLRTGLSGFAAPFVNAGDAPAAKFDKEGNPIEDAPKRKSKRHKIKPVVELKKMTAPRKRNASGGTPTDPNMSTKATLIRLLEAKGASEQEKQAAIREHDAASGDEQRKAVVRSVQRKLGGKAQHK